MKKLVVFLVMALSMNGYSQSTSAAISNFRVEDGQEDRVYFDVEGDISGMTAKGFVISGKIITGVNTSGKYFTVSKPFTFWDNNTIRLGDITDKDDIQEVIHNFTLRYIKNKIPEPSGTVSTYYVSTSGNDINDGKSKSTPWRKIGYAAKQAKAGDVVYVKAGNYGGENVIVSNSGTAKNPIKFIGYKNEPGDKPSINRSLKGVLFKSTEMPLLKDGKGYAIRTNDKSHIIFRNFQIENYSGSKVSGLELDGSYMIADNIYVKGVYSGIHNYDGNGGYCRIINSFVQDCSHNGVKTRNQHNLVKNTWVVSTNQVNMDYYIAMTGGNQSQSNIVTDCKVKRYYKDTHPGHGISFKGENGVISYSLAEKSTIIDVALSIEARHNTSRNNVFRDIHIEQESDMPFSIGLRLSSPINTTFESIRVVGTKYGIAFLGTYENPEAVDAGNGNVIKNCIFENVEYGIRFQQDLEKSQNRVPNNNSIINSTFAGADYLYRTEVNKAGKGNLFKNVIFSNIKSKKHNNNPGEFEYSYSNFYSDKKSDWSSNAIHGEGNMSEDPKFESSALGNFRLKSDSPLIDKGKMIEGVETDFDGEPRPSGNGIDIGAHEYQNKNTSQTDPVKADAGKDQSICSGSRATLTATGGTEYSWSTGETTQSIQVNPTTTTNFTVTVSDGVTNATDEVTVTVIKVVADAGADVMITAGEEVTLKATGGDQYEWSTGETGPSITVKLDVTTTFSVKVVKDGCTSTDEVMVQVEDNDQVPSVIANAGEDRVICLGEEVVLNGSGGINYSWSTGEDIEAITVSPTETTTYTVTVSNGLSSDTDDVTINVNNCGETALNDEPTINEERIQIYPNPSQGILNLYVTNVEEEYQLSVVNLTGSIMRTELVHAKNQVVQKQLDLSNLEKGVYFIMLNKLNYFESKKIILL